MRIALILSGGIGTRLGYNIPKQYIPVGGRMVITHCLRIFGDHSQIDAIWIVADERWHEEIYKQMPETVIEKFKGYVAPGANRQRSILNGLEAVISSTSDSDSDIVIVHDAVRPLVSESLISACVEACSRHDGVLPVLPMKDTVYWGEGEHITSLLSRDKIYSGQAPEAFRLRKYYEANRKLIMDGIDRINGSTEPAVMAGMDIVMIPGDEDNFKITTPADLERFKLRIKA